MGGGIWVPSGSCPILLLIWKREDVRPFRSKETQVPGVVYQKSKREQPEFVA